MRSSKLVSLRLNAVVWELAMFPDTFSSAKDCARSPVTAVVRAPKIPMRLSPTTFPVRPQATPRGLLCKPRATDITSYFQRLDPKGREPRPGKSDRCRQILPGRTPGVPRKSGYRGDAPCGTMPA